MINWSVFPAAPTQYVTPVVGGQPVSSTSAMQYVPQPVNYSGISQQYVPAGYGFYPSPMMYGPGVPATFPVGSSSKQFAAVNGAPPGPAGNTTVPVAAGTQQAMAQPAAGSWSSQTHQVVNPFLVSIRFI